MSTTTVSEERIFLICIFTRKVVLIVLQSRECTCKAGSKAMRRRQILNWIHEDISLRVFDLSQCNVARKAVNILVRYHPIFRNINLHFSRSRNPYCEIPDRKPMNLESSTPSECYICPSHRNSVTPSNKKVTNLRAAQSPLSPHDIGLVLVANLNKSVPMFRQLARARKNIPREWERHLIRRNR